jgi:hypothetical protein
MNWRSQQNSNSYLDQAIGLAHPSNRAGWRLMAFWEVGSPISEEAPHASA